MACRTVAMKDGDIMWLCGDGLEDAPVCRICGHMATKLCDFPVGNDREVIIEFAKAYGIDVNEPLKSTEQGFIANEIDRNNQRLVTIREQASHTQQEQRKRWLSELTKGKTGLER
ncbi:MAG TPA: hypothetical protein VFV38_32970 [Ktedonobacteraceae bacterium]|nr:hypothetical protein [Ktedonobacteraceae bacterium]